MSALIRSYENSPSILPTAAIAIYGKENKVHEKLPFFKEQIKITHILVPQILLGHALDLGNGDAVDGSLDLSGGQSSAARHELSANVLCNSSSTVQSEEEGGLQLRLGSADLGLGWGGRHPAPFSKGEMNEIVEVFDVLADHVDAPQTRVRVRSGEGHITVGEVVLGDDVAQRGGKERAGSQRAIPVAEDGLQDEHGEVVGRAPPDAFDGNSKVGGGHSIVTNADLGTDEV